MVQPNVTAINEEAAIRYNMQPRAWLNRVTVINADTYAEYKRVQGLLGDSDELIPLIDYVNDVY
jgi:hypothetical protein|tara:strand:+ start:464 stop:655 length:192 start_codon:yes stop_codon:yes gene_type:complete